MITGPQEGEFFVDEAVKPIPIRSQWDELTTSQLIDVQLQLEDKLWTFAKVRPPSIQN